MRIIPLKPLPSQVLNVVLNNQNCQIKIYQKFYGLFIDLYINDVIIIGGVIAEDRNRIVRSIYLGFIGDLAFVDTQGQSNPEYSGLGDRFFLAYFDSDEVTALVS